jgi:mandelamide amidase
MTQQWLLSAAAAGVELIEIDLAFALEDADENSYAHCAFENYFSLADYFDRYAIDLSVERLTEQIASTDVKQAFADTILRDGERAISELSYRHHMQKRRSCIKRMRALLAGQSLHALAYPTIPGNVPYVNAFSDLAHVDAEAYRMIYRNADAFSYLSMPVVTLPLGVSPSGLPVGLSLAGPWGQDRKLLALALRIQST